MLSSNNMQIILCLVFLQLCLINAQFIYPEEDRIIALPDQPKVNFSQCSGYITVDDKTNRSYFYYFVESEKGPFPFIALWRNGGLGCGSVSASFGGNGPFRVNVGGKHGTTLFKNPYSFNREAHMLYVDSPAGAGFSCSPDGTPTASLSDESIARDDFTFLQRWLEKFPHFKDMIWVIGGEGYASQYILNLVELIRQSEFKFVLWGLMLVNPVLNRTSELLAMPEYLWAHGMISDETYQLVTDSSSPCNFLQYQEEYFNEFLTGDTSGYRSPACVNVHKQISSEYLSYEKDHLFDMSNVKSDTCDLQTLHNSLIEDEPDVSNCASTLASMYLDRKDVQQALKTRKEHASCNGNIYANYSRESIYKSVLPALNRIIRSEVRVLVVSGDQDGRVPLTSTRKLVEQLAEDIGLQTNLVYTSWIKSFENFQTAGFMKIYGSGGNLTYATVKGAGHSLSVKSAEAAVILFKSFLNNQYNVVMPPPPV